MKKYVVGFMFDDQIQNVCLIKKNRPEWQLGKLNGVGGKVDARETPLEAMVREFREETGVATLAKTWAHVCTLRFPYAEVDFYAAKNTGFYTAAQTMTDEAVVHAQLVQEIFMGVGVVENVPSLLELSIQRLSDRIGVAPAAWQKTQQQES